MAQLSEWLKLMVAEINRKRDDAERDRDEELKRQAEVSAQQPPDAQRPKQERARA